MFIISAMDFDLPNDVDAGYAPLYNIPDEYFIDPPYNPTAIEDDYEFCRLSDNPTTIYEDYICFYNTDGKGSKVETLPEENLGSIEDLKYFNNKLITCLRVPAFYLLND